MISVRESELRQELSKLIKDHPNENVLDDLINAIADAAYAEGLSSGVTLSESINEVFNECN